MREQSRGEEGSGGEERENYLCMFLSLSICMSVCVCVCAENICGTAHMEENM